MSKLTYEDKINLYTDKKGGMSIGSLSNKYKVSKNVINYLTALIDKHGIDILRTNKKETIEEENERLKKENLYLKAELEYSKKLRAVVQARKNQQQKKK